MRPCRRLLTRPGLILLGLSLDDPGFDHTVLSEFRALITHVATTDATVTDNQMTGVIDDELTGKTLAPGRHYLDSGYLTEHRAPSTARMRSWPPSPSATGAARLE